MPVPLAAPQTPALPPLVAVAHGSRDPRAAAVVADLMALVQARGHRSGLAGLQARAAFLGHALPSVPPELLDTLDMVHGIREAQRRGQAKVLLWP